MVSIGFRGEVFVSSIQCLEVDTWTVHHEPASPAPCEPLGSMFHVCFSTCLLPKLVKYSALSSILWAWISVCVHMYMYNNHEMFFVLAVIIVLFCLHSLMFYQHQTILTLKTCSVPQGPPYPAPPASFYHATPHRGQTPRDPRKLCSDQLAYRNMDGFRAITSLIPTRS
jgi:hypothetical protein